MIFIIFLFDNLSIYYFPIGHHVFLLQRRAFMSFYQPLDAVTSPNGWQCYLGKEISTWCQVRKFKFFSDKYGRLIYFSVKYIILPLSKAQRRTRVSRSGWPIQTFCSTVYFLCHYEKVKYPWCLIISLKDEIKRQGILLCSLQLLLSTTVAAHHTVNNLLL